MRLYPAIDLREGAVVQLVGGDYAAERLRRDDARAVADEFLAAGFDALHVVDLDAATGRGSNAAVIASLLGGRAEVQVGGGVRTDDDVARWLDAGAARVVVGTRAVLEPAWLERAAARHPGRLLVAADVRGREVVVRGWAEGAGVDVLALARRLSPLPLAGLLVTAVHKEGLLGGVDAELYVALRAETPLPIVASGGVATTEDVRRLRAAGAAGAVIGTALYTGDLRADEALREANA